MGIDFFGGGVLYKTFSLMIFVMFALNSWDCYHWNILYDMFVMLSDVWLDNAEVCSWIVLFVYNFDYLVLLSRLNQHAYCWIYRIDYWGYTVRDGNVGFTA